MPELSLSLQNLKSSGGGRKCWWWWSWWWWWRKKETVLVNVTYEYKQKAAPDSLLVIASQSRSSFCSQTNPTEVLPLWTKHIQLQNKALYPSLPPSPALPSFLCQAGNETAAAGQRDSDLRLNYSSVVRSLKVSRGVPPTHFGAWGTDAETEEGKVTGQKIWCLFPRALKTRQAEQVAFGREGEEAGQTASKTDEALFTWPGAAAVAAAARMLRSSPETEPKAASAPASAKAPPPAPRPRLPSTRRPDGLFGGGKLWIDRRGWWPMGTCSGARGGRMARWVGGRRRPISSGAAWARRVLRGYWATQIQAAGLEAVVARLGQGGPPGQQPFPYSLSSASLLPGTSRSAGCGLSQSGGGKGAGPRRPRFPRFPLPGDSVWLYRSGGLVSAPCLCTPSLAILDHNC